MGRTEDQPVRALLVGTYLRAPDKPHCMEHLDELERLADTYGANTIDKVPCSMRAPNQATFLGSGKVKELAQMVEDQNIGLVIFDDELAPSQQRNLEKALKCEVYERTEVILAVFAKHARTKEARLQVELATLRYQFPRLKRMWTHLSRQRGGGLAVKGEGEKQIEIDRRLLNTRIAKLTQDLKEVRKQQETRKARRQKSEIPTFAIVGYTNAGKSTLLNALTHAEVLVEDRLFATLDTTTRKFRLPNHQEILLSDTVGFIRKIPHQLVAAFKSTLDEAVHADVLLHVVDASSPTAHEQVEATMEVLKELKADQIPMITILNKSDQEPKLRRPMPRAVRVSALTGEGLDELATVMEETLASLRQEVKLCVPQKEAKLLADLRGMAEVLYEEYEENNVCLRVRIPKKMYSRVEAYVV